MRKAGRKKEIFLARVAKVLPPINKHKRERREGGVFDVLSVVSNSYCIMTAPFSWWGPVGGRIRAKFSFFVLANH
jgi:hypothetical protein